MPKKKTSISVASAAAGAEDDGDSVRASFTPAPMHMEDAAAPHERGDAPHDSGALVEEEDASLSQGMPTQASASPSMVPSAARRGRGGSHVYDPRGDRVIHCPTCGRFGSAFVNFCTQCGSPLKGQAMVAERLPLNIPVATPVASPIPFGHQTTQPLAASGRGREGRGNDADGSLEDLLERLAIDQQARGISIPDPLSNLGGPFTSPLHQSTPPPSQERTAYFSPPYHTPGAVSTTAMFGDGSPIQPQSLFQDPGQARSVRFEALPSAQNVVNPTVYAPSSGSATLPSLAGFGTCDFSGTNTGLPHTIGGSRGMFSGVEDMISYFASMPRPLQFVPSHFTWDRKQGILYPCVRLADIDRVRVLVRLENHRLAVVPDESLSTYNRDIYRQWVHQYLTRMQRGTHGQRFMNSSMLSKLPEISDPSVPLLESPLVDASKGEFVFRQANRSYVCAVARDQLGVDDDAIRVLLAQGGMMFAVPKASVFPISCLSWQVIPPSEKDTEVPQKKDSSPTEMGEEETQSEVTSVSVSTSKASRRRHGGDDGEYSSTTWYSTRGSAQQRIRYPVDKVQRYTGRFDLDTDPPARPFSWADHIFVQIAASSIPAHCQVYFAIMCVADSIRQDFIAERIRPRDASVDWALWSMEEGEMEAHFSEIAFKDFIWWLHRRFFDKAIWTAQQRVVMYQLQQSTGESVQTWNHRFEREWRLWFQLDPDAQFGLIPKESYAQRSRYLAGLRYDIRQSVVLMSSSFGIHLDISSMTQEADEGALISRANANTIVPLSQLKAFALRAEMALREVRALQINERPTNSTNSTSTPWRRTQPGSSASKPDSVRMNCVQEIEEDVEVTTDSGNTCEELYSTLATKGLIPWSRAQLQALRAKNLCFRCAQSGHRKSECRNPIADPKSTKFSHAMELEVLPHDDEFFHLLAEFSEDFSDGESKNE
jgi:hypothetical protein